MWRSGMLRELCVRCGSRFARRTLADHRPRYSEETRRGARDTMYYVLGTTVFMGGLAYGAVPAYRLFCEVPYSILCHPLQATAYGGTTQVADDLDKIEKMTKVSNRLIRVQFNADLSSSMQWRFKPLQDELWVHPGETALAFYSAYNPSDKPIVGISSYNLVPYQAAYYFTKIQCFCFEEQILNPGEQVWSTLVEDILHLQVDLPVFFYIDPDYANDPALEYLDSILLSYTFYASTTGLQLPSPFDPANQPRSSVPNATEPVKTTPVPVDRRNK